MGLQQLILSWVSEHPQTFGQGTAGGGGGGAGRRGGLEPRPYAHDEPLPFGFTGGRKRLFVDNTLLGTAVGA